MKKIVSFALWGELDNYIVGAIQNAKDVKKYYPGWVARFYCGRSVPNQIIERLKSEDAEVIIKDEAGDNRGMFWRFEPIDDEDVERVIVRDVDSRISSRECEAVQEWVESGLTGHIMRDHPYHNMVILGGMWGCLGGGVVKIKDNIKEFKPLNERNQDQLFLAEYVYPVLIRKGCLIHDSFFRYESFSRDFPSEREEDLSFVGEQIDANGQRSCPWMAIQEFNESLLVRIKFRYKRLKRKIKNKIIGRHMVI